MMDTTWENVSTDRIRSLLSYWTLFPGLVFRHLTAF